MRPKYVQSNRLSHNHNLFSPTRECNNKLDPVCQRSVERMLCARKHFIHKGWPLGHKFRPMFYGGVALSNDVGVAVFLSTHSAAMRRGARRGQINFCHRCDFQIAFVCVLARQRASEWVSESWWVFAEGGALARATIVFWPNLQVRNTCFANSNFSRVGLILGAHYLGISLCKSISTQAARNLIVNDLLMAKRWSFFICFWKTTKCITEPFLNQ